MVLEQKYDLTTAQTYISLHLAFLDTLYLFTYLKPTFVAAVALKKKNAENRQHSKGSALVALKHKLQLTNNNNKKNQEACMCP